MQQDLDQIASCDTSDNDSEFSYTDLISEYTNSKTKSDSSPQEPADTHDLSDNKPKNSEWELENLNTLIVPRKYVVKWAAQLLLALEKLHSLGVICW